jgi:hypothetical protein
MANLGNIGRVIRDRCFAVRDSRTLTTHPTGNSASNSGDATANARVVLVDHLGGFITSARASGAGTWTFNDLGANMTYFVSEVGSTKQWSIVVDAAGSPTVAPLAGQGGSVGYAG